MSCGLTLAALAAAFWVLFHIRRFTMVCPFVDSAPNLESSLASLENVRSIVGQEAAVFEAAKNACVSPPLNVLAPRFFCMKNKDPLFWMM